MDITANMDTNTNTDVVKNTRVEQLDAIQSEARELFKKKNADYGDSFATYGTIGVLVRLGDKIQRLQSITSKGINLVEDEKLRDTLIDLHNYAAMGIMLLDSGENLTSPPADSLPYPTFDQDPIETFNIVGSTGEYVLKRFKSDGGRLVLTCSCPSYKFCVDKHKSCKHIKQFLCAE